MWVVCNLRRRAASSASWRGSATPLPTTISLSSQPVVSLTACLLLLKTNLKSNDQEMTKTAITFPIDEPVDAPATVTFWQAFRSEEHTSELQSLMRISYAVFCMKNKKQ